MSKRLGHIAPFPCPAALSVPAPAVLAPLLCPARALLFRYAVSTRSFAVVLLLPLCSHQLLCFLNVLAPILAPSFLPEPKSLPLRRNVSTRSQVTPEIHHFKRRCRAALYRSSFALPNCRAVRASTGACLKRLLAGTRLPVFKQPLKLQFRTATTL